LTAEPAVVVPTIEETEIEYTQSPKNAAQSEIPQVRPSMADFRASGQFGATLRRAPVFTSTRLESYMPSSVIHSSQYSDNDSHSFGESSLETAKEK